MQNSKSHILVLIFGIILLYKPVIAQPKAHYQHYSTKDGLSHGSVIGIMQDRNGFMWFSTWDGLNRFDGVNFKIFKTRPGDSLNLSSNRVEVILEDKWNCIWLKTYDSKIFRLQLETEQFDNDVNQVNEALTGGIQTLMLSKSNDLWLATEKNGLYRIITGPVNQEVQIFHYGMNAEKPFRISGNQIGLLFEDTHENIWFTTENGIQRLNKKEGFNVPSIAMPFQNSFDTVAFTVFYCNFENVYLGTSNGKFLIYNLKQDNFETFNIGNFPVSAITCNEKQAYIGTDGDGLHVFNLGTKKNEFHYRDRDLVSVYKIYEDSHGFIWLETNMKGAIKINPLNQAIKLFTQVVDVEPVLHIISQCRFEEQDNNLWLSLKGGGFGYYNREKDELEYFYNEPGALNQKMSNFVPCFYIDNSNVLWLSTYKKGIEKFTLIDNHFRYLKPDPLSKNDLTNEVRAIYEDHQGVLWLGTKSGDIYLMDTGYNVTANFSKENNLKSSLVYSIIEDDHHNIWLGTKGNGVYQVIRGKNGKFRTIQFLNETGNLNSLSDNNVYSLMQDDQGKIWVATYGGGVNILEMKNDGYIFRRIGEQNKNYPSNCCNRIRQIKKDTRGNIWLATTEGLLFVDSGPLKGGEYNFRHFYKKPNDKTSLGNNDVYCIFSDMEDSLWFGTLGGGLQKLVQYPEKGKEALFRAYTVEDGLSSDVIFSIESDINNNLWMSSENGLMKFDHEKNIIKNYNENDGLVTSSFSEAASFKRNNGNIVFGAYNGIYYFDPEKIRDHKAAANLKLTEIKVLNKNIKPDGEQTFLKKSVTFTNEIVLNNDQNVFELSFAALDFRAIDKTKYTFKLDGFDNHWRHTKIGNVVYTKVPPGNYTFKVKIENPEIEQKNHCTLNITIKKPYWKSALAYVIYAIILIMLLLLVQRVLITMLRLRNRVVVEKHLSELKIKFFTNISHELRTPLTLIQGPVEEISNTEKLSEKGKGYIALINLNTARMMRLVNQLLDFRKIQHKKMKLKLTHVRFDVFAEQICSNFKNLAREKNIDFQTDFKVTGLKVWIDEEKMDIVIFNLLSNAFKFTPTGKKIRVLLEKQEGIVKFSVHDQGIGIEESKKKLVFQSFANIHDPYEMNEMSTGLGLSLSKEIIELHKGKIYFWSEAGHGTTFIVELKTGRDHFSGNMVSFIDKQMDIVLNENDEIANGPDHKYSDMNDEGSGKKHHENILIVEDNAELRKFIKDILSNDFNVFEAVNGKDGYNKTLGLKPLLIVSDVMMPEVDGIEMLGMLRDNFDTSHIPVILLTAKSSVESRIEGLRFGADAYMTKPFNSLHLITLVNSIIEQRKKLINKFSGSLKMVDFADEDIVVTDRDGEFLKRVIELIEENLSDPDFKVETISKAVAMGRTNFFNKMKGLTNLSPIDFIKEYRLNKAQHFLDSGNYNISEASYKAGFNDPGYFSKCFKEKFGKSPSQYIKTR